MSNAVNWNALYDDYIDKKRIARENKDNDYEYIISDDTKLRMANPASDDIEWLTLALKHPEHKWFVAYVASLSNVLAEVFFVPLLDAGIDEVNPSFNRRFIEPCMKAFGPRRVNEYLIGVVETGTDFRKAGAVNALYWAQIPLSFSFNTPSFDPGYATEESQKSYQLLNDLWTRKRVVFLETFVSNSNVDVRCSIIPSLDLDTRSYPKSYHQMVAKATEIARSSEDDYIRHRVEYQLGSTNVCCSLPDRHISLEDESNVPSYKAKILTKVLPTIWCVFGLSSWIVFFKLFASFNMHFAIKIILVWVLCLVTGFTAGLLALYIKPELRFSTVNKIDGPGYLHEPISFVLFMTFIAIILAVILIFR